MKWVITKLFGHSVISVFLTETNLNVRLIMHLYHGRFSMLVASTPPTLVTPLRAFCAITSVCYNIRIKSTPQNLQFYLNLNVDT